MLSAEYLDGLTSQVLELYAGLNETIARDIARRIVKTGSLTTTAHGQIAIAQESGMLFDEVTAAVAKHAGRAEQHVRDLFLEAGAEAVDQDALLYKAAELPAPPLPLSASAMQILLAGAKKTNRQLRNLTKTTALEAQRAYIRAATLAEMQVESGAFDAVTAIRNAVREALKDGATVQYPSGHRDRVDVAVRRAVLTGVNQTCAEIGLHNAAQTGCDLVEVTAHGGARPEHAAWQGKVYSVSGKHPKYPPLKASTGYGTGAGLCGWNCRHSFYPFFEGLSERAYPRERLREYETRTVRYRGRDIPLYEATQMQRERERAIRATRRTLAGYDEAMKAGSGKLRAAMQADFSQASVRLKKQEARLKDFLLQTGLRRDSARVQVNGFGRSVSQRAVWANKPFRQFVISNRAQTKADLLPNQKSAIIPDSKLAGYALNKEHPVGKHKAIVFERALGYTKDNAFQLEQDVRRGLEQWKATARPSTTYGAPFEVKMLLTGPNGKTAIVKTAWMIDKDADYPRLVSLYVDD